MRSTNCLLISTLLLFLAGGAICFPLDSQDRSEDARDLYLTVGKSIVIDSPKNLQRVSVASEQIAEAVVATPREMIIIGRAVGETTVILWQESGARILFDLHVRPLVDRNAEIQQEMDKEFGAKAVSLDVREGNVFVRGTVNDAISADRALAIAAILGKPVNLLSVKVPGVEAQVLLRVRFADVDRAASSDLGVNFFSLGGLNTVGGITTGQYPSGKVSTVSPGTNSFTLSDALNILLFRPDLNLGATIKALQTKRLLQILAEPNLLTMNGRNASFLAGGEFPYPTLQGGGAGLGAVTIQFREFGVRLSFTPTITPRGTIHLRVTPEVSTLDYANGLVFQGFNIPALSSRRVSSEIELQDGQSFAIAGLLDNRVTEAFSKIPGLANIPFFGNLFKSKSVSKANTELLVLVTPELVRPIPQGMAPPDVMMPSEFIHEGAATPPRTPGSNITGPVPVVPPTPTITYEQLKNFDKIMNVNAAETPQTGPRPVEFVPVPVQPQSTTPTRPPGQGGNSGGSPPPGQ